MAVLGLPLCSHCPGVPSGIAHAWSGGFLGHLCGPMHAQNCEEMFLSCTSVKELS